MPLILLTTAGQQRESLVNTETITTVTVSRDEATNERVLAVTFVDGSHVDYRPVTAHGNLQDYPEHKPAHELLKALRSYIERD